MEAVTSFYCSGNTKGDQGSNPCRRPHRRSSNSHFSPGKLAAKDRQEISGPEKEGKNSFVQYGASPELRRNVRGF